MRVAIPGDFAGVKIPATLAQYRKRWPDIRFVATATSFENMVRGLRQGDIDLAVAIASSQPSIEAHHLWMDQAVWVRSDASHLDPGGPVPLVSFGEDCSCRYTAVNALHRVGRECDFVFTSRSIASLEAAVLAGLGIMVLPRSRVPQTALSVWGDAPLPELVAIPAGPFVAGSDRAERDYAYRLDEAAYGEPITRTQGWYDNEKPRMSGVTNAYRIARTPITNRQYAAFIAASGRAAPDVDEATWRSYRLIHPYERTRRHAWRDGQLPEGVADRIIEPAFGEIELDMPGLLLRARLVQPGARDEGRLHRIVARAVGFAFGRRRPWQRWQRGSRGCARR